MRRSTRKPRLNQEVNRCARSAAIGFSRAVRSDSCNTWLRIATRMRVPSGAMVQPAEQLLARRLHHLLQAREMLGGRVAAVSVAGPPYLVGIRRELPDQRLEKSAARRDRPAPDRRPRLRRQAGFRKLRRVPTASCDTVRWSSWTCASRRAAMAGVAEAQNPRVPPVSSKTAPLIYRQNSVHSSGTRIFHCNREGATEAGGGNRKRGKASYR